MNLPKAIEIVALEKNGTYESNRQDLKEALTIALVCMSYSGAMIEALGQAEIAQLTKGN
ncbi:unnamed protein product [marine sediment metagenome]|uniref:Uncharacterized protein n=1 Tax=marine sediment metagenome TaxID=412755 RepID=X1NPD5_9ZZZZ